MEENKNTNSEELESNSAKIIRMLGTDEKEDIHLESDKKVKGKRLDNFWYQHKWKVIIGAILLVALIFTILQIATRDKQDLKMVYAGPEYMMPDVPKMSETFAYAYDDYNGDGEKIIGISTIMYQTDDYRDKLISQGKKQDLIPTSQNQDALAQFESQIMSGEVVVYLLDPELYEIRKLGTLNLESTLGIQINNNIKYDENAVYFKKTEFAKYFKDTFEYLPDNTLLCMVKTLGTDEELLNNSCNFVKRIIEFEVSE